MLYLMRHGPAEDTSPSGRDFDRELSAAGSEVVRASGALLVEALGAQGALIDRIFVSPFVRAQQTSRIVVDLLTKAGARSHGSVVVATDDRLRVEHPPDVTWMSSLVTEPAVTLVIGHQPMMGELAIRLGGDTSQQRMPLGFRTAMIARLSPASPRSQTDPIATCDLVLHPG